MMKYPIGIQSFNQLIEDGYVYVDKTALVYNLVKNGKIYFLSRPRRFGKSLLVSTLKCYFEGRKDLFKGLAMERLETEWAEYPVFHIDFNGDNFTLPGTLEQKLASWTRFLKASSAHGKRCTGGQKSSMILAVALPTSWRRPTGAMAAVAWF